MQQQAEARKYLGSANTTYVHPSQVFFDHAAPRLPPGMEPNSGLRPIRPLEDPTRVNNEIRRKLHDLTSATNESRGNIKELTSAMNDIRLNLQELTSAMNMFVPWAQQLASRTEERQLSGTQKSDNVLSQLEQLNSQISQLAVVLQEPRESASTRPRVGSNCDSQLSKTPKHLVRSSGITRQPAKSRVSKLPVDSRGTGFSTKKHATRAKAVLETLWKGL